MGIYVFNTDVMYELLFQDAARKEASSHDFGRDIIPAMIAGRLAGLCLSVPRREPQGGRLLARRRHSRRLFPDQHGPDPDRSDPEPLRPGLADPHPPAALPAAEVCAHRGRPPGAAYNSIVCQGAIISGGQVYPQHRLAGRANQQLRPDRGRDPASTAWRLAAMPGSAAPSSTRTCEIPAGFEIGWNREADLARGFTITDDGIIVVAKGEELERFV